MGDADANSSSGDVDDRPRSGDVDDRPRSGRGRHVPFIDHLGIVRESAVDGQARITLELRPELLNNHAGGHGGVVMTLLDCAMAHAALSRVDYVREVVTVAMQVAFMRPALGRLVAVGRVTGGGRSVCFCEAHIVDADGQPAAHAMGTFRYVTATLEPAGAGDAPTGPSANGPATPVPGSSHPEN